MAVKAQIGAALRFYCVAPSPYGKLKLFSNGDKLTALYFPDGRYEIPNQGTQDSALEIFKKTRVVLEAYFAGDLKALHVPLAPQGTEGQQKIWRAMQKIKAGDVLSYGGLAEKAGLVRGARAAASACARNPVPLFIPCHRVVAANGALTGYSGGGLQRKAALLKHEGYSFNA